MKPNKGFEMSVVAATYPMLKRGPVRDFKLIMKGIGRWRDSRWNQTTLNTHFQPGRPLNSFQMKIRIEQGVQEDHIYL
jgi:hypothetical protein